MILKYFAKNFDEKEYFYSSVKYLKGLSTYAILLIDN